MNRRDFLLFRTESRRRIAELSCQRLYMRYLDSQLTETHATEPSDAAADAPCESEPPRVFGEQTTRQLFDNIERDLHGVNVLRVLDGAWLARDDFRRHLEPVLESFLSRGGRLEY